MDTQAPQDEPERRYPAYLRLAWSNPNPEATSRAARARVDFALAIERQLAGADGLTRDQFLAAVFGPAGRGWRWRRRKNYLPKNFLKTLPEPEPGSSLRGSRAAISAIASSFPGCRSSALRRVARARARWSLARYTCPSTT